VVHLASTESTTGGSTDGDDGESSDAGVHALSTSTVAVDALAAPVKSPLAATLSTETRRNTQLNETIAVAAHEVKPVRGVVGCGDLSSEDATVSAGLLHQKHYHHHRGGAAAAIGRAGHHRGHHAGRREKSPSDLEADDENDHDSLNQVRKFY